MIEIIIFATICLTVAVSLIGFMCYHMVKMSRLLIKLNRKLIQNDLLMQLINKKFTDLEPQFNNQLEKIKAISKNHIAPSSTGFVSKEAIEQNYERAKNLVNRGMSLDTELMRSCNMTEEEFELLS
ncbi:MAG: hypothetical protein ACHP65_00515 [Legionellales bacterium]